MTASQYDTSRPDLGELLIAWLDDGPTKLALVDRNLNIIWASAEAQEELARRTFVEQRGSVFTTVDAAQADNLAQFLKEINDTTKVMLLREVGGTRDIIVHGRRVWRSGGQAIYGLMLRDTDRPREYLDLAEVFRLTKAEHRVLKHLLDGTKPEEISSRDGVSLETIRSQIRQIYAKLGVSSRSQLFTRVRPYSL